MIYMIYTAHLNVMLTYGRADDNPTFNKAYKHGLNVKMFDRPTL